MDTPAIIAALEAELAGYVRRGLSDRAELVRQELRRLGSPADATIADGTVPVEPASTPKKATTATRKPAKATKKATATGTRAGIVKGAK